MGLWRSAWELRNAFMFQGYFQLKANPGTWYLRIREGRSSELYEIASTENTEKSGKDVAVLVTNFRSKVNLREFDFCQDLELNGFCPGNLNLTNSTNGIPGSESASREKAWESSRGTSR